MPPPFNPVCHVFCFLIGKTWHRTARIWDDRTFERLMGMLDWALPYNMKVFHFTPAGYPPVSNNSIFLAAPQIDADLPELFKRRIGVRLKRAGQEPLKVLGFSGGFVIVETGNHYGRLLKCSASDELSFEEYYPIPFAQARVFVDKYHRHNVGPQSHKFSIGLLCRGEPVGVIIASTPKARALDDGFTLEMNRCCVLPEQPNACSKLYARAIAAGRSMGYRRFITYTLIHESGSSLKAVGFKPDGITRARPNGWNSPSRPRKMPKRYPSEPKRRWILQV